MKTTLKTERAFYALMATVLLMASCTKEESATAPNMDPASSATSIAVAASASSASDSIVVVDVCNRRERKDSISEPGLPTVVVDYLTTNYAGYTFQKAFSTKDASGNTTGYVVVIYFNDKPVALKFDASGTFVKVLEQRERGDLDGPGHHDGGRFEHRDGRQRDTIALNALPLTVITHLTANFSTDTLVKAFKNKNGGYVVLSKNNGAFAIIFDSQGIFIKRVELATRRGHCHSIEVSSLPSGIISYLKTTYPNYVFKKAFVIKEGATLKGYIVFIDANNTKYAVEFDATGNFVKAKTIL